MYCKEEKQKVLITWRLEEKQKVLITSGGSDTHMGINVKNEGLILQTLNSK